MINKLLAVHTARFIISRMHTFEKPLLFTALYSEKYNFIIHIIRWVCYNQQAESQQMYARFQYYIRKKGT